MLILAVLLPFHLLFNLDYAPAQLTDAIIEFTPPDNAIWLQNLLGVLSFPAALLGGVMLTGLCAAFSGMIYTLLSRWSRLLAALAASALLPLSIAALFPIRYTPVTVLPLLLIGPLLAVTLRPERVRAAPGSDQPDSTPLISRRQLLINLGLFSLGGIVISTIDSLPAYQFALNAARAGARLFDFTPPAARQPGFPAPGEIDEVTAVADFYEMRKSPDAVSPVRPDWQLVIDGLVDKPLTLSLAEIQAHPRADVYITRQCVSNPVGGNLISTALMSGARLSDVLAKAGVQSAAREVVFYGRDGYAESVPLADALDRGLLVYAMNGLLLPDAHGAPLKVEVPGLYGFRNMKWLARIALVAVPFQSVWIQEGWTALRYKTMSRIDAVTANPNGGATICGVAFGGLAGIQAVEVQINGGDWLAATLNTPPLAAGTWLQWRIDLPQRGSLTVKVRATDGQGQPQIDTDHVQFPDGATGLHTLSVQL